MAEVTVVTPAHNEAEVVGGVIASVLGQCYDDIEHVIVDDGSTDETVDVVRKWCSVSKKVQLVTTDGHAGPASARNIGAQYAKGKYLLFVDADDLLSPRYVDTCVTLLERQRDISFVYTDEWYFMTRGGHVQRVLRQMHEWSPTLIRRFNIMSVTALMRRYMFLEIGGFRSMPVAEDYDFWLFVCNKGYVGIRIPEALFYHQIRTQSRWSRRSDDSLKHADKVMREAHGDIPRSGDRRISATREDVLRRAELTLLAMLGSTEPGELRFADGEILSMAIDHHDDD